MIYSKRADVLKEMLDEAESHVLTATWLLSSAQDGSDGPIEDHERHLTKVTKRRDALKWAYNLALLES